jgi:outer membrane lipoprotein LolB
MKQLAGVPGQLSALVLVMLLAGCRTAPIAPIDWPKEKGARQALAHWEMSGRAAVATGKEGYNASLRWIQQGSASEAHLKGALGVGGIRVRADGDALEVETSKGERLAADEAGPALERAVGVQLPIRALRYWLLGVPVPHEQATEELDEQGRLVRLEQQGWVIAYDRYANVDGSWLPGRTKLERGPVRVRVVADRWEL